MSSIAEYYLASIEDPALREKYTSSNITIPLKSEGEEVVIDAENDLPDDSSELSALLSNEECAPQYWITVAKAYAVRGQWEEAQKVVSEALESETVTQNDPKIQAQFHGFLTWLYLARSSDDSALEAPAFLQQAKTENETALHLDAGSENSILAEATLLLSQSVSSSSSSSKKANFDKESALLNQLLRKNSRNCYALLGKARIFFYREDYQAALKVYQKVLMLNPLLSPDPRIGVGICFWFLDHKDLAVQAWQNSVLVHKDLDANLEAKVLLCLAKFDYCFTQSVSDEDFRVSYQEALDFTKACYLENPANNVVQILLASFYFMKGEYDTVNKICDHILNSGRHLPANIKSDALFWQARCKYVAGETQDAQRLFSESLKQNDKNVLARVGYGQCQVVRGQYSNAIRTFEKVLDARPQSLDITYALGMLYAKLRRYKKQAIESLEKYIKLADGAHEPVAVSALFALSKLYEDRDLTKALEYLEKARKQEEDSGKSAKEVSYALLNNIGALSTLLDKDATEDFETALKNLKGNKSLDKDLKKASDITLRYNVARSKEATGKVNDSMKLYEKILEDCPHYTSAKIRYLLLACLSQDKHIKEELDTLLSEEPDNMELRSFYGWYLKNYGKKHQLSTDKGRDLESELHRDTLVKHNSHDLYALVSLANVYSSLAREVKDLKKKEQYFVRAAQLFQKVLGLDPKDVYAAQGVAILFMLKKDAGLALEIFRKARDTLNDKAVYTNLAHCLLESKQYAKALENYQYALDKFTDGNDTKLLNLIGKTWLARGVSEKSKEAFDKALEAVDKALSINKDQITYKYNKAFVQFQLADFIRKLPPAKRTTAELESATEGLREAIKSLEEIAADEDHKPPYAAEDIKLRAEMGEDLIKQLEKATEEQAEYQDGIKARLEEAKRKHDEEEKLRLEAEAKLAEEKRKIEEKMAAEHKKLEEQQEEWNKMRLEEAKDAKDEVDATAADDAKPKKGKGTAAKKGGKGKKVPSKKSDKSDEFVVSSDSESEPEAPELNDDEEDEESEPEPEDAELNDDEEAEPEVETGSKKRALIAEIAKDVVSKPKRRRLRKNAEKAAESAEADVEALEKLAGETDKAIEDAEDAFDAAADAEADAADAPILRKKKVIVDDEDEE